MEQQNRECRDEINLYDLWNGIAKRKMLIIGLFIAIVGSTAVGSFMMPKIYRGEVILDILVLKSERTGRENSKEIKGKEIITAKEIIDLMGNVDREKLKNVAPKSYNNINDIKFKAINDSKYKILVTIDTKKPDDISTALPEVVNYLNNISSVKSAFQQEKDILLRKSVELSKIVKLAPDLLATYDKQVKAGTLSMIGFNPIMLHKDLSDIRLELFATEQQLSKLNSDCIKLATQAHIFKNPISPKILFNVILAGIFSLLFGAFLAIFLEYIENIKNKKRKQVDSN